MACAGASAIDALLKMLARERLDELSVLEMGALDGASSRRLEALGASVTTYETSREGVEAVRHAFPQRTVHHVDLSQPWSGMPRERFDLVIAPGLLDHVEDWAPFVRFARQVAPRLLIDAGTRETAALMRRLLEELDYIVTPLDDDEAPARWLFAIQRHLEAAAFAPVLVHVHMLKCAGCSVRRLFGLNFGDRHFNMYDWDPAFVLEPDEITRLLLAQPAIASISSHGIRSFPPLLGSRVPLYVTFLRDPATQLLSYIKYVKNEWATLSDEHRRRLPPDGEAMPMREFARWLVTSSDETLFNRDYAVRYVTEIVLRDELRGLQRHLGDHAALTSALNKLQGPVDVELAISVLEGFFFVGLVEEMHESMALLRERLAPYGFELETDEYRRENISPQRGGGAEWLTENDEVGRLVLQSLRKDYRLYNHFKARFREQHAAPRRRHLHEERPRYERLAAAMPQYGLNERSLREALQDARQELGLLRTHLRNILSSRYMRLVWMTRVVKKPEWVDEFLRSVQEQDNEAVARAEQ